MRAAAEEPGLDESQAPLRRLVAVLVAAEAVVLLLAAVFLVIRSVLSDQEGTAELLSLAAIALIVGAGLAVCARGVLGGLRWTKGPVLTWQLLQAAVGAPLSSTEAWKIGVPLFATAVVVGILISGRRVIPQPLNES